jgi:hypothetical protein
MHLFLKKMLIKSSFCFNSYTPNGWGSGGSGLGGYDMGDTSPFVDSTTSSGTCFEPRSNSTDGLPDSQNNTMSLINNNNSSTGPGTTTLPSASIPADSIQISELLARTITDAHTRTCLYSNGMSIILLIFCNKNCIQIIVIKLINFVM